MILLFVVLNRLSNSAVMGDNSSEACADISGKNRGCRNENIGAGSAEAIQGRERHLLILAERTLE